MRRMWGRDVDCQGSEWLGCAGYIAAGYVVGARPWSSEVGGSSTARTLRWETMTPWSVGHKRIKTGAELLLLECMLQDRHKFLRDSVAAVG